MVEGANLVAVANSASEGVGGMHFEIAELGFHGADGWDVGEGRIHVVVGLAGEELEREALARGSRSVAGFGGRSEGDEGIESLGDESFGVELGFAAGRGEVAVGKGQEGRGGVGVKVEADVGFAFEAIAGDAVEPWVR